MSIITQLKTLQANKANCTLRENWFTDYDPDRDQSAWHDLTEIETEQADWEW
jgi:hypothetical protein